MCSLNLGVTEQQRDCLPATPYAFYHQASPGSQEELLGVKACAV